MLSASLRRRAIGAMLAAVGLTIVTGCALTSPAIVTDPHNGADGANAELPLEDGSVVSLRNFVVVMDEAGGTGQVIGAITYDGTQPVILTLETANNTQVDSVDPTEEQMVQNNSTAPVAPSVTVGFERPGLLQIGPEGVPFVLPVVKLGPGQHLDLTAKSPTTGAVDLRVPIMPATHYYAGLTATPSPTAGTKASATPTESAEPETTETTSP